MFMDSGTNGGWGETYVSAGSSHDLSVRADRRGHADALVEVAWNRSKLGAALLQLMREWDGAAKQGMRFEQSFLQMKALPAVRGAMVLWALGDVALPPRREQLEEANSLSWSIVTWWLDPACKGCCGTGWVTPKNAPKKPCTSCHGTCEAPIPQGNRGRALVKYLEDSIYRARASVRGRAAR